MLVYKMIGRCAYEISDGDLICLLTVGGVVAPFLCRFIIHVGRYEITGLVGI